jgi:hypothetical protein
VIPVPVGEGLTTPGDAEHLPGRGHTVQSLDWVDFARKRVLDIGCRDGLRSFEAQKRGASEGPD